MVSLNGVSRSVNKYPRRRFASVKLGQAFAAG